MKSLLSGFAAALLASTLAAPAAPASYHQTLASAPPALVAAAAHTIAQAVTRDPAFAIAPDGCATLQAQRLTGCFGPQGPAFTAGDVRLGLALAAWGRRGLLHPEHLRRARPQGNRITYRGRGIREWWRVSPLGYEQGYTLDRAPAGPGPVVLQLRASAAPRMTRDGSLAWGSLRYGKLHVTDASGRVLAAYLMTAGTTVQLVFDADHARYPVTIDPLVWTQQEVSAADGAVGDYFGISLALSSDGATALVGAHGNHGGQGAAYVFANSGGIWAQTAKLTANDGAANDNFAWSVALSSDGATALVGANNKTIGSNSGQGAAYVFASSGGIWTQAAKLTANDGGANDNFGDAIALSGDGITALVGAMNKNNYQGMAYVFTRPISSWATTSTPTAELTAANGAANDKFSNALALSSDGGIALIGAMNKNNHQGMAYVFTRPISNWATTSTPTAELTAVNGAANDFFGSAVALSDNGAAALVGAYGNNNSQGAAYVFANSGGAWTQAAKLTANDGAANDSFGNAVALSSDGATALVGANNKTVGSNSGQGAAYLFTQPPGGWATTSASTAEFTASDGAAYDNLGWSSALSGNGATALVGANNKTVARNAYQGAAYFFPMANLSGVLSVPSQSAFNSSFNGQYFVTNSSAAASGDIQVQLPLPASGASYVSVNASQGSCGYDSSAKIATCDLGSIRGGGATASTTLILTATASVGTSINQNARLANTASGSPTLAATASTAVIPAAPTVGSIGNVNINSSNVGIATFSITGTGPLAVAATSSNTTLLPNTSITEASGCIAAGQCVLTLIPAPGQTGSTTVTVTVTDKNGLQGTGSFPFVVTVANTASSSPIFGGGVSGGAVDPWMLLVISAFSLVRRRPRQYSREGD